MTEKQVSSGKVAARLDDLKLSVERPRRTSWICLTATEREGREGEREKERERERERGRKREREREGGREGGKERETIMQSNSICYQQNYSCKALLTKIPLVVIWRSSSNILHNKL